MEPSKPSAPGYSPPGQPQMGFNIPPQQQGNLYPQMPASTGYPNAPPPKYEELHQTAPVTVVTHAGMSLNAQSKKKSTSQLIC